MYLIQGNLEEIGSDRVSLRASSKMKLGDATFLEMR